MEAELPRTLFTADTHFGHANIIHKCQRPFACAQEMDEALIANWNAVVRPQDTVYHLGDVAFRNRNSVTRILGRLNGQKHLVWGNHDSNQLRKNPLWASSTPYVEATVDGQRLVLFHYAMRVWSGLHRGAIHLYGHSHGSMPGTNASLDVGVDCWNYHPVSLDEIMVRLATLPSAADLTILGQSANIDKSPDPNNRTFQTTPDVSLSA